MKRIQYELKSKVGSIFLIASDLGLHGIYWRRQNEPVLKTLTGSAPAIMILKNTVQQLQEYFEGKRKNFDLPFNAQGTEFQKSVWGELTKIPYGKTCSYSDIAEKIKNHKAVRAVGTANGKNPFSIIVPCHRVIAANGTLGGYAGGLEVKTKLLELEKLASLRK